MLPKTHQTATLTLLLLLVTGCASVRPWRDDPPRPEVNFVFLIENNLLRLPSVEISGRSGRYYLGSAHPRTVFDPSLATALGAKPRLQLTARESLPLSPVSIPLAGVGDAIIGADAWGSKALTIDYHAGLLTFQKEPVFNADMTIHSFRGEPAVEIEVDGRRMQAVVDTALPDTLVLPSGSGKPGRRRANVQIAGSTFSSIDIAVDDVTRPRIGNRLLAHFLVTIDYGRRRVALWRDPRTR